MNLYIQIATAVIALTSNYEYDFFFEAHLRADIVYVFSDEFIFLNCSQKWCCCSLTKENNSQDFKKNVSK